MRSRAIVFGFALGVVCLVFDAPSAGQDRLVGALWEITHEAKKPKTSYVRRFRATPDGKIWAVPKQGTPRVIGTWEGDESKATMHVDAAEGKTTYEIVKIGKNPPSWQGTARFERNGKSLPVKVRLLAD